MLTKQYNGIYHGKEYGIILRFLKTMVHEYVLLFIMCVYEYIYFFW